ncbi:N-acetyltransferase [Methanimicrococcus blatticola]|uniref:YoaP-like protein n=1 Tax=Methanimicrococcus blatticola TaxID=91560 RepID=A0A484F6A2_9EURY|nr:YoaP domain-containing protein [Methanimicrococcus blatticola]MBZ3935131.1 YoaP domain-containing protein [Methanimicrococcus blatticola]MCC2508772.1 YoaP domain-containing protein [Methanimicrococcus blatticola]TDQ71194.1 YoaP-like protein [Methanimicrococcus blatticola]
MEIITVTKKNIGSEHICCAISNDNDCQVSAKKTWLAERFDDGLVFKKGDVRGKCFIEYIPAENAWAPVEADGYMYINCFWVSGQYKGQGNSSLLLDECIRDSKAKNKKGLVILSSDKKRAFLSDPKYLVHKGFEEIDSVDPFFKLFYLPFEKDSEKPGFKDSLKESLKKTNSDDGFVLYYSHQCPFTAKYVPLIEEVAREKNVPFKSVRFQSREEAQSAPTPFTSYSLFLNDNFVTNEILSVKKFENILSEYGF